MDEIKLKKALNESFKRHKTEEKFLESLFPLRKKVGKDKYFQNISEDSLNEIIKEVIFENTLDESVLDPVNKTRCPDIFDSKEMVKEKVRKQILEIVESFKEALDFDFKVRDIFFIGSSSGFQYTETSDIDINLFTTIPKAKARYIFNKIPKGIMLEGTQRPINIFLIYDGEEFEERKAENIYDIQTNDWIKKTGSENIKLPYSTLLNLARFFMNGCDLVISQYERDKWEYLNYSKLDPETQEITENEKAEAMDKKLTDLRTDVDSLKLAHHIIFAFEQEGFEGFPFRLSIQMEKNDDPRYSPNVLVYKIMDRFGYLDKLNTYRKEGQELIKNAIKKI